MIEDEMGKMFPAIKVVSMCIAALVDDMVTAGGNTVAGVLKKSDVHWVLTVPAIWSDAAKQFMREAAQMEPVIIKLYFMFRNNQSNVRRYKKAKIRKRRNQKKIPTPKTEVGKNQTNNQVLIP